MSTPNDAITVGMVVSHPNLFPSTTVASFSGTDLVLSQASLSDTDYSGIQVLTFSPGNGAGTGIAPSSRGSSGSDNNGGGGVLVPSSSSSNNSSSSSSSSKTPLGLSEQDLFLLIILLGSSLVCILLGCFLWCCCPTVCGVCCCRRRNKIDTILLWDRKMRFAQLVVSFEFPRRALYVYTAPAIRKDATGFMVFGVSVWF